MAVAVSSNDEHLLCLNDAVLHPIHVEHPDWYAVFDFSPQQLLSTRQRLFTRATDDDALVLAFHFPFPGLGHVVKKDQQWKWRPVRIQ
jgi:glyoxylase-like metal-dependent hydrolase (beta-lactamase superfamily II)